MKYTYLTLIALLFAVSSFGIGPITGSYGVCIPYTTTLSDATPGGTWASSNIAIATVGTTGVVTGIANGTAVITYTVGAAFATLVITVAHMPTLFSAHYADTTFGGFGCIRDPRFDFILSGSEIGVNYDLFSPCGNRTVAGTGHPIDFGIQSCYNGGMGSVSVRGTNNIGCMVNMGGLSFTTEDTPALITGPATLCVGSATTLIDSCLPHNYNPGTWASSNTSIAIIGSASGIMNGIAIGTAVITYSNNHSFWGVCNRTKTVTITTSTCTGTPLGGTVSASSSLNCSGKNDTFTLAGYSTCNAIQWQSSPDGLSWTNIPGANTDRHVAAPVTPTWYRCTVTCIGSGLSAVSTRVHVSIQNHISSHTIVNHPDTFCTGAHLYISACGISSLFNVTTWYGDGTTDNVPLTTSGVCHADIFHGYANAGTYSIKQVLFLGTIPQDSVTFTYEYLYCRTLPLKFYLDANSNCAYDTADVLLTEPVRIKVDSNGMTIDTVSATSGLYYKAYGPTGTVYAFRIISYPGQLFLSCPGSGVLYDTIKSMVNTYPVKYAGFSCSGSTAYNLGEYISFNTGRHMADGMILVNNTYCTPENALVRVTFSPKYKFTSAIPTPSSVTGNTVTWNFTGVNVMLQRSISFHLDVPNSWDSVHGSWNSTVWLHSGDTINSEYHVTPIASDVDTTNNNNERVDTVKFSYDPNEMSVTPQGYILPCTPLQYTINFENTGNAPAQNISVLDTLPANIDPHSLRILAASAVMNISYLKDGGLNIVKFDFPGINLPDSSHHNQCDGMVVFTVKTRAGIADGTVLPNRAGIYFDDNEVVMTNSVENIIGISPITGNSGLCLGSRDTLADATQGGTWSMSNARATILAGIVTGITEGLDTVSYTVSNSCATKAATKVITINAFASAGMITGPGNLCTGATITLNDTTTGGIWTSGDNAIATINTAGVVTGISQGNAPISYTLTNGCGTRTATVSINVVPLPVVFNITGGGSYCNGGAGMHIRLTGSVSGIQYQLFNGTAAIGSYLTGTGTALDFGLQTEAGTFTAKANNSIANCSRIMADSALVTITPNVTPSISISANPGDTICNGTLVSLTASPVNGGTSPAYIWRINGANVASGTGYSYLPANGDVIEVKLTTNAPCALPDTAASSVSIYATEPLIPQGTLAASPATTIAAGQEVTFTSTATNAGPSPVYQWLLNNNPVPGATNATYTTSNLNNGDSISCSTTSTGFCGGYTSINTLGITVVPFHTGDAILGPNPNNGEFTIKGLFGNQDQKVDLEVTNMLGQAVYKNTIAATNGYFDARIKLGTLTKGVYTLNLRSAGGSKVLRFVIGE